MRTVWAGHGGGKWERMSLVDASDSAAGQTGRLFVLNPLRAKSSLLPLYHLASSSTTPSPSVHMDGHKRKRDDEGTVVTFYAPNRTFARVYKGACTLRPPLLVTDETRLSVGQSLSETKEIVRKKLGLSDDTSIRFARLHEGNVIELDDGMFPILPSVVVVLTNCAKTTTSKHSVTLHVM